MWPILAVKSVSVRFNSPGSLPLSAWKPARWAGEPQKMSFPLVLRRPHLRRPRRHATVVVGGTSTTSGAASAASFRASGLPRAASGAADLPRMGAGACAGCDLRPRAAAGAPSLRSHLRRRASPPTTSRSTLSWSSCQLAPPGSAAHDQDVGNFVPLLVAQLHRGPRHRRHAPNCDHFAGSHKNF